MAPTYLALDIGEKRIGVAVGSVILPVIGLGTILLDTEDWQTRLTEVIHKYGCLGIVLGYPEVKSGQATSSGELVLEWQERLKKTFDLPVMLQNEAYSSVEAERQLRSEGVDTANFKHTIDERSAILILENYLTSE